MRLQDEISEELWLSVSRPYQAGIYSNAITEAIHYLSNLIREKSSLDGDGIPLVGQAFGGDNPRIRINKFQTETEKNEQKGLEAIIRGIYQGIRNPRSHNQIQDTRQTADAIILFVNYIIDMIGQSKFFSMQEWIQKIIDQDFVATQKYASILLSELPNKKHLDALVEILRNKDRCIYENLVLIFEPLYAQLNDVQKQELLHIISEDLRKEQEDHLIDLMLKLLPREDWLGISEAARMRIENRLIRSIKEGRATLRLKVLSGGIGLHARSLQAYFTLKKDLYATLREKLTSSTEDVHYVLSFLNEDIAMELLASREDREAMLPSCLKQLPSIVHNDTGGAALELKFIDIISQDIVEGSTKLRNAALNSIASWPRDWENKFLEALKPLELTDPQYIAHLKVASDDLPF